MSDKETLREPSDIFKDAVADTGSMCSTECEFCGRIHFVSGRGHGDYDEGELEALKLKAAEDPDKYIEESVYDSIRTGHVEGRRAVVECPCHKLRRYEDWIWSHREIIVSYLMDRSSAELAAAQRVWDRVRKASQEHRNAGRVLGHIEDAFQADRTAGTLFALKVKQAESIMKDAADRT